MNWDIKGLSRNIDPIDIIKYEKYFKWDYKELCRNKDINYDILHHFGIDSQIWNWYEISKRIHISTVINYPNLYWDKSGLSENEDITIDILKLHLPNSIGSFQPSQYTSRIAIKDIFENPSIPWNMIQLSKHKQLTIDYVLKFPNLEWHFPTLSQILPINDIIKNHNLPWILNYLSCNKDIRIWHIHNLKSKLINHLGNWDWKSLSTYIPFDEIKIRPSYKWNRIHMSYNKSVSISDVVNNQNLGSGEWSSKILSERVYLDPNISYNWDIESIMKNKTLTIPFILNNPTYNWDWTIISQYININQVRRYPNHPWCMKGLSHNIGINIDDIKSFGYFSNEKIIFLNKQPKKIGNMILFVIEN